MLKVLSLNISTPNLKHLVIFDNGKLKHVDICAPNLKRLVIFDCVQRLQHVEICALNLMSFTFLGRWIFRPPFVDVPVLHLSHVCLALRRLDKVDYFQELLGQISHVNTLSSYMVHQVIN